MEQSYTVTKTTVECYKLRHSSGMYWADITLDQTGPNAGRIAIASDFGSWNTSWNAMGGTLKEFLTKCDIDYLCKNFANRTHFNADATIKGMKDVLFQHRRKEWIEQGEARKVYDAIVGLAGCHEKWEFEHHFFSDSNLTVFFETLDISMEFEPGLIRFFEMVWPEFIKAIAPVEDSVDFFGTVSLLPLEDCYKSFFGDNNKNVVAGMCRMYGVEEMELRKRVEKFIVRLKDREVTMRRFSDYVVHCASTSLPYICQVKPMALSDSLNATIQLNAGCDELSIDACYDTLFSGKHENLIEALCMVHGTDKLYIKRRASEFTEGLRLSMSTKNRFVDYATHFAAWLKTVK